MVRSRDRLSPNTLERSVAPMRTASTSVRWAISRLWIRVSTLARVSEWIITGDSRIGISLSGAASGRVALIAANASKKRMPSSVSLWNLGITNPHRRSMLSPRRSAICRICRGERTRTNRNGSGAAGSEATPSFEEIPFFEVKSSVKVATTLSSASSIASSAIASSRQSTMLMHPFAARLRMSDARFRLFPGA